MNETSGVIILFAAIFTNNILLANFLGMCHFLACSRTMLTAFGLGVAMTIGTGLTCMINYVIYYNVIVPYNLELLMFLIFITIIAGFVQFAEMFLEKFSPTLYNALGIYLPLLVVNCTIMGASLFMIYRNYSFSQTAGWGFGAGAGWMLAAVLMAALRKKAGYTNPPAAFKGAGLTMIIAGLISMTFMGFAGIVSID